MPVTLQLRYFEKTHIDGPTCACLVLFPCSILALIKGRVRRIYKGDRFHEILELRNFHHQ